MNVVGIDPGMGCTGWACIRLSRGKPDLYECGLVKTKTTQESSQRLHAIYSEIHDVIKKEAPNYVAIEKTFLGKNVSSLHQINMARGVIVLACYGYDIKEYEPRVIKKSITGSGNASKEEVHYIIRKEFQSAAFCKKKDILDAIAIGLHCFYSYLRS